MALSQENAKYVLSKILGHKVDDLECTGDIETCPIDECMICAVRDCPYFEPLHYHHDGCPACYNPSEAFLTME